MKLPRYLSVLTLTPLAFLAAVISCNSEETNPTTEVSPTEPGSDAAAPTDAGAPAPEPSTPTDASVPDASTGGAPSTFEAATTSAICGSVARCCGIDGGASGRHFNVDLCTSIYDRVGFEGSLVDYRAHHASTTVNPAKASECIARLGALPCDVDGPTLRATRAACFDAVEGNLGVRASCKSSIECARGLFCLPSNPTVFESGGTCVPLRTQGQSCGDVEATQSFANDSVAAEAACSWRGGGDTNLACSSYDLVTGRYKSYGQWTCEPKLANGEICNTSVSCSDGVCDPGENDNRFVCVPTVRYFPAHLCAAVTVP
jgi:hypothetical protein